MSKKLIISIIISVIVLLIIGICLFFFLSSGTKHIGVVYEEGTNKPLSGVCVTDGRNVVKTNDDGSFILKGYRKSRFIVVTVPSGYTAQKYYIPVSKDTASYDFYLSEEETPTTAHTFLQLSDTEIGEKGTGEWLDETKRLVDELKPKFIIHTGDICYEAGLKQHINNMNSETMGCDVKYIIGNHDYVKGDYGEQLYESIYGPVWYSFEVGDIHYVVTPIQYGDVASGYNKNDRWRWLENDLKNTDPHKKVVIFNHTNSPSEDYTIKFDMKELDLKKHNLAAWIFGHYHYNFINNNDDVLNISTARPDCGGIDQSASGTRQINIDKDGNITTKLHYYDMNNRDTVTPENTLWSTKLKGNVLFSDPLNVDDKIFVGTIDDDYPRDCGVYSIDAKTGNILWEFKTKNSIKNSLGYSDGRIIAQDCEGRVYCLDQANGTLLWEIKVQLDVPNNTSTGICVYDGVAFTGSGSYVTAIDVKTGEKLWVSKRNGGECSPARIVVNDNKLIVSSHWNNLYSLNKNTGEKLWEMKDDGLRYRSTTPSFTSDGKIVIAAVDSVFIIDAENGKTISKTTFEDYNFDVTAKPLIDGDLAYISTAKQGVVAFNLKTLQMDWTFETKKALVYTSPYTNGDSKTVEGSAVLKANSLIFGASDGYIYELDKQSGSLIKETFIGAPVFTSPVIYDNSIICSDFTGRVIRLK